MRADLTRFGRFLRNTHFDELPQFLNVLKGEMNVIGPRPEMVEIEAWASEHVEGFSDRLALKPGITGCAQITQGYTRCDVEAYATKLAIEEGYRRNLTFVLDVGIAVGTALWMLRGRGWQWNVRGPMRVDADPSGIAGPSSTATRSATRPSRS